MAMCCVVIIQQNAYKRDSAYSILGNEKKNHIRTYAYNNVRI